MINEKTVKYKFRTFFFVFFSHSLPWGTGFGNAASACAQHSVITKLALKDEKKQKEKYCFNPGILLDFTNIY